MVIDDKVAFVLVKLSHLAVQRDREAYLRGLIDLCAQATDAERCTVYFVDQAKKELWSRIASRTAMEIRLPLGTGISGQVALTGETVNVPDAYADPRFDRNVDLRSGYRTLNMLVVPVWDGDGQAVIGVMLVSLACPLTLTLPRMLFSVGLPISITSSPAPPLTSVTLLVPVPDTLRRSAPALPRRPSASS